MVYRILMSILILLMLVVGPAGADSDSDSDSDNKEVVSGKATTLNSRRARVLVQRKLVLDQPVPRGSVVWLRDGLATPTQPLFFYDGAGELIFAVPAEHFPAIGVTLADGEAGDTVKVATQGQVEVRKPVGQVIRSGSIIVPSGDGEGVFPLRAWCEGATVGVAVEVGDDGDETVMVELRLSAALQAFQPIDDTDACGDSLARSPRWRDVARQLPELAAGEAFPWLGWAVDPDSFGVEYDRALEARASQERR